MSSLLTGLVASWKMNEVSSSDNAFDAHGSNPLTQVNTPGVATGKIGGCRTFATGAQEYFSHTSNSDLQMGDIDATFQVWVNLVDPGNYLLIGKDVDTPANSRDYTFDVSGGSPRFYVNGGGGGLLVNWGVALTAGLWYHILAWHDAANNQLGIVVNNGTPVTASTGGTAPQVSAAEFRVGARAYSGFESYLNGSLDEVDYWKRMLTAAERSLLYNGGNGLTYPFKAKPRQGFAVPLRPAAFTPGLAR